MAALGVNPPCPTTRDGAGAISFGTDLYRTLHVDATYSFEPFSMSMCTSVRSRVYSQAGTAEPTLGFDAAAHCTTGDLSPSPPSSPPPVLIEDHKELALV